MFGFEIIGHHGAQDANARFAALDLIAFARIFRTQHLAPLQRAAQVDGIAAKLCGDLFDGVADEIPEAAEFGFARGEAGGGGCVCHETQCAPARTPVGLSRSNAGSGAAATAERRWFSSEKPPAGAPKGWPGRRAGCCVSNGPYKDG